MDIAVVILHVFQMLCGLVVVIANVYKGGIKYLTVIYFDIPLNVTVVIL